MFELLRLLEESALGEGLRSAGVWTYGLLNLAHILGLASLFGAVLLLDLRLLGIWRTMPPVALIRPCVPVAATGFVLAATSGTLMLTFNATEYHGNIFLYIKLPVILLGLINVAVVQRVPAWHRAVHATEFRAGDASTLAVIGAVSLLIWLTVVVCGRMIGYW